MLPTLPGGGVVRTSGRVPGVSGLSGCYLPYLVGGGGVVVRTSGRVPGVSGLSGCYLPYLVGGGGGQDEWTRARCIWT